MEMTELMAWCRSYRRFDQRRAVPEETLARIMEAARLANSATNRQALRYAVVRSHALVETIFPMTHWAAMLPKELGQPKEGEHPTLFIVPYVETAARMKWTDVDLGLAVARMTLTAAAEGVGSCILGNIEREAIRGALGLPETAEISVVVAFGYPTHRSTVVPMRDGDVKYVLDENGDYRVPKRSAEALFTMY